MARKAHVLKKPNYNKPSFQTAPTTSYESKRDSDGEEEENEDDGVGNGEEMPPQQLADMMTPFFKSGRYADVCFVVGEKQERVLAHRFVLAASSAVFAAMLYPSRVDGKADAPPAYNEGNAGNAKIPGGLSTDDAKPAESTVTIPAGALVVKLPAVDAALFKILLEVIYTDQLTGVDADTILPFVSLANAYWVEKASVLAAELIGADVNEDNALELLQLSFKLGGRNKEVSQFVEENTDNILSSDGFLKLKPDALTMFLDMDELGCEEGQLFDALIAWGKKECARQNISSKPDTLKLILQNPLKQIRFPIMTVTDLATKVAPTQLLDQNDLVQLFAYCALDGSAKKKSKLVLPYSTKERGLSGERPDGWFPRTQMTAPSTSSNNTSWPASNTLQASEDSNSTYWLSPSGSVTNHWIVYDVGRVRAFNSVRFKFHQTATHAPRDCELQTSNSSSTGSDNKWKTVWAFTTNQSQVSHVTWMELKKKFRGSGRYWRLFMKNNHGDGTYILVGRIEFGWFRSA